MLHIFICEYDDEQRMQIETLIRNHIMIENLEMKIQLSTSDPLEFLDYLEKQSKEQRGVYFFNVDLKSKINGVQLAAKVREKDTTGKIVFITIHSELLLLTFKYKVEALDYILKESRIEDIKDRIIDALEYADQQYHKQQIQQSREHIRLKIGSAYRFFDLKEILYIDTSDIPHKLNLHLRKETIDFYGNIGDIPSLSPVLIRVHKSYVVNYRHIAEIDKRKREITMINGEKCLLGVKKYKFLVAKIQLDERYCYLKNTVR